MAVKKCCIESCNSSTSRSEDIGVTFHKYPKDTTERETWLSVTQKTCHIVDNSTYVCSRHFCKSDFRIYQDSKYVLKPDAVPSIFSWIQTNNKINKMDTETSKEVVVKKETHDTSTSSNESVEENVEAIKKYIESQEKEILNKENDKETQIKVEMDEEGQQIEKTDIIEQGGTVVIGTSVMDMILSDSGVKIEPKKEIKTIPKHSLSSKGNSVALAVGSKVEVKDFSEFWYPAEILEVDYDEMEVLVHYEGVTNKHDEWISINSPRLRPVNKSAISVAPVTQVPAVSDAIETVKEEIKVDEKPKVQFAIGERCLARWRDNRRFIATVANDLGKGVYEIIFDDGFQWKCSTSRLYKLKDTGKHSECLTVDTSMSPTASTPSPVLAGAGPSTGMTPNAVLPIPIFHTHLFDPTRDYLGSKSERREMKRKLNIKEIFNIGQKKRKKQKPPNENVKPKVVKEKKPRVILKKIKLEALYDVKTELNAVCNTELKTEISEIKSDIPDAVASIIGTVAKEEVENSLTSDLNMDEYTEDSLDTAEDKFEEAEVQEGSDKITLDDLVDNNSVVSEAGIEIPSDFDLQQPTLCIEPEMEEEQKLENFEKPDDSKKDVIEKMKEVISKLEVGLNIEKEVKVELSKPEVKIEPIVVAEAEPEAIEVDKKVNTNKEKSKRKLSKIKKSKKLRLLQEKKVKKQVAKVKSELEEMKRQVEEMRKQILKKTEELSTPPRPHEMPESFLLPGEWCCKWVNGQPVGSVSEIEADPKTDANNKLALPRRSVQVEDKRLPEGWSKHMVRRRLGQSAGKWDVVLVSPNNHRFHTKNDMRSYLEQNQDESLKPYECALLDFGVHLKLSRRMGWFSQTGEGASQATGTVTNLSPLAKAKKFRTHRKDERKEKKKRRKQRDAIKQQSYSQDIAPGPSGQEQLDAAETAIETPSENTLEDGCVYVGSLKVQTIDNLLRCPAEGCYKNFRNDTLLQMHIKHYHRELRIILGVTPKVLDLARKRTKPAARAPGKSARSKVIKIKISRPVKRVEAPKEDPKPPVTELNVDIAPIPSPKVDVPVPRSQDSPKLRQALANKPVKRPKVLLPVRRPDPPEPVMESIEQENPTLDFDDEVLDSVVEPLDFETEISTHTVTKPFDDLLRRCEKKRKCFSTISKRPISDDEELYGVNSDFDTRSSFLGSGTPDSKIMDKTLSHQQAASSESAEDQKEANMYMYTETGERVKIEHMKREEIINCHCGFREEDGLMVQCELCLCWQHALCHNIQKESEVPEKYTCSICLNPRRGRRSKRFLHDQDRLYEGLLPGTKPCESLRRSHELSGNLLRIQDALHALRVKYYVATKKDHPKLYLWAKDWENAEVSFTQERLNSDYSDLNIIINNIGKENLPVKPVEVRDGHLDMRTPITEDLDHERFGQRDSSNSLLLTTALSSPGGASLDLPITTSELERLAKSVQEQEVRNVSAPQPEAAIENSVCRDRLLRHVQRCQALLDARLDSIEAQVAELESQDPSFEDDETADYFPRTKQTVQMLMRDLDTMEELGIIT